MAKGRPKLKPFHEALKALNEAQEYEGEIDSVYGIGKDHYESMQKDPLSKYWGYNYDLHPLMIEDDTDDELDHISIPVNEYLWLKWFAENVYFGTTHKDVMFIIREYYESETGNVIPENCKGK